jgi:hypothetical protein
MGKINLELPNFNYKNYHWEKEDNVTSYGRAKEFEEQNEKYRKVGYTQYNTMYYRAFNVDDNVHKFCETLFPRYSVGIMKQPPGQTLPLHDDTFYMFAKLNKIDPNDCIRVNVFLEDWQNGHYFEINGNPVLQWNKGDAIIIKRNELHLSGNMGMADKYTMQITGVLNEFKRS